MNFGTASGERQSKVMRVDLRHLPILFAVSAAAVVSPVHSSSATSVPLPPEPNLQFAYQANGLAIVATPEAEGTPRLSHPTVYFGTRDVYLENPDWSPDGQHFVFDSQASIWLSEVSPYPPTATKLYDCPDPCAGAWEPAWSPDGASVAFATATATADGTEVASSAIVSVDPAGGALTTIYEDTSGLVTLEDPRWSPDGTQLVLVELTWASSGAANEQTITWARDAVGEETLVGERLLIVDVASGTTRVLLEHPGPSSSNSGHIPPLDHPDWSPLGDRIVYQRDDNLWLIKPDGTGETQLTVFDGLTEHAIEPTFTPDGEQVIFAYVTGTFDGYYPVEFTNGAVFSTAALVNVDGTGFRDIGNGDWMTSPRMRPERANGPTLTAAIPPTTLAEPSSVAPAEPTLALPTFPDRKVIASLSAVSDSEWFALSDFGPGGQQSYPVLRHTVDAGATWVDIPLSDDIAGAAEWMHFADPMNGWIGSNLCCLLATHDGGVTWKRLEGVTPWGGGFGDFGSAPTLTSFDARAYVLADVVIEGNSRVGVMSSPVDSDDFVWSGTTMGDARWGLKPFSGQLVVNGESGWAIAFDATAPMSATAGGTEIPQGAARRIDGEWTAWAPPCALSLEDEEPFTTIVVPRLILGASRSGGMVAVICSEATSDGSPRTFVATDDGATFVETTRLPDGMTVTDRSWIMVPDDDTILAGVALDTGEPAVARSDDLGASWTVDTTFGGDGEFATATVTPTGRIVVVATIVRPRRDVAQFRDEDGTWLRLRSS